MFWLTRSDKTPFNFLFLLILSFNCVCSHIDKTKLYTYSKYTFKKKSVFLKDIGRITVNKLFSNYDHVFSRKNIVGSKLFFYKSVGNGVYYERTSNIIY
jgi:hypothetical protein